MNSFGRLFRISIFGESHGEAVGVTLDGVPAGLELDETSFEEKTLSAAAKAANAARRRVERYAAPADGRLQRPHDRRAVGHLFHNENTLSGDYKNLITHPRPSHSDWVAIQKFRGIRRLPRRRTLLRPADPRAGRGRRGSKKILGGKDPDRKPHP